MSQTVTPSTGTLTIPEGVHEIPPTAISELDRAVEEVATRSKDWVALEVPARIALLERAMQDTLEVADTWVETIRRFKGMPEDHDMAEEGWIYGPVPSLRAMRLFRDTLRDILETGRPQPPDVRTRPDGQVAVKVFPTGWLDQALYQGTEAEIRVQADVGLDETLRRLGRIYRPGGKQSPPEGACLVLGAGNVTAIPVLDVLSKMFVEDRVCVLKMNPVNEAAGPILEQAMRAFIDEDYLRIVYGGAEVGKHLTDHDLVDHIHITGSDKTHDAIMFGTGEDGRRRKSENTPRIGKEISSELGNVTPVIVVPGPWSESDLEFQGHSIGSMLWHNGGFNCIAARVIIQHREWSRRRVLLDAIRDSLRRADPRTPYYPGAEDRWTSFTEAHPEAETYGPSGSAQVPMTLIPDVDPSNADDIAFTTEAFCGVFSEVGLDAPRSVPAFLDRAVEFCNDTLWGTLGATILVHPKSLKDPAVEAALERAIDDLRYGTVAVNHWTATGFSLGSPSWGAYPGHSLDDIQSGRGVVHNTYMVEDVEKSVLRGPFRQPLKPFWFHSYKTMGELGQAMARLEGAEDLGALPRAVWASLRA